MAIQRKVPLVPVTLLTNYQLLPNKSSLRMHPGSMRAILHQPVSTLGLSREDVPALMEIGRGVVEGDF